MKNPAADALSRLRTRGKGYTEISTYILVAVVDLNKGESESHEAALHAVCSISYMC